MLKCRLVEMQMMKMNLSNSCGMKSGMILVWRKKILICELLAYLVLLIVMRKIYA